MSASSTTAPVIRASAGAIARLAKAFVTWKGESSFAYHMMTLPEGQDRAFWDAMVILHAVSHNVDEAYRTWQDLEREFGKDYTNIHEHIRLAIANAVVSS